VAALRDQLDTFWNRALSATRTSLNKHPGEAMSLATMGFVRREIVVRYPIDRAFAVFVERFGDSSPRSTPSRAEIAETRFEPRVGGHIYDRRR